MKNISRLFIIFFNIVMSYQSVACDSNAKELTQKINHSPLVSTVPTSNEFIDKIMLLHVGILFFDESNHEVYVNKLAPVSYWTMNSIVPNDMFISKAGRSACVILTPLKKRIGSVASICAEEVMLCGACKLGKDDVVFLQEQSTAETYYSAEEQEKWNKFIQETKDPILLSQVKEYRVDTNLSAEQFGSRQFYSNNEISILQKSGVKLKINLNKFENLDNNSLLKKWQKVTKEYLIENNFWHFYFDHSFWTHKTNFVYNGSDIVNQESFFMPLLNAYPQISFGYGFYSKRGYGSLFKSFYTLSQDEDSWNQYGKVCELLFVFYKNTLINNLTNKIPDIGERNISIKIIEQTCHPEKHSEEASDERSKSFDSFILGSLLPMSPEIFYLFTLEHGQNQCLTEKWPLIIDSYKLVELYRQQYNQTTKLNINKAHIYENLSQEARNIVFDAATGRDFIRGDGLFLENDQEDTLSNPSSTETFEDRQTKRIGRFNKAVEDWFLSKDFQ